MANDNDTGLAPDTLAELVRIATDSSFDDPDPGVLSPGIVGPTQQGPVLRPTFQDGGVVAGNQQPPPRGAPAGPQQPGLAPAGGAQPKITAPQMQAEAQRLLRERPQEFLQLKNTVEQAIQAGEVTMEEINLAGQLATAALQNPQLWPQLRRFAIQKGLADEEGLSPEYDQGLVFAVLLAVQAVQGQAGSPGAIPQAQGQPPQAVSGAPQAQGQPPVANLRRGGEAPPSHNKDGSVAAILHAKEFVIPADVVERKGTDFFNKMIGVTDAKNA